LCEFCILKGAEACHIVVLYFMELLEHFNGGITETREESIKKTGSEASEIRNDSPDYTAQKK
jgi:hypothetical protein